MSEKISFEEAMSELETIVEKLEADQTRLDDAVALYERGQELRKICQERLMAAQERVAAIVENPDGTINSETLQLEQT
ncbi:MAG: exodeoxyribonuclease VII small subunit [Alphaproteobacteria bacterium]|nr:exodeoxyribonuclease VII small subunit [Alphaproteobacteria bacterium]